MHPKEKLHIHNIEATTATLETAATPRKIMMTFLIMAQFSTCIIRNVSSFQNVVTTFGARRLIATRTTHTYFSSKRLSFTTSSNTRSIFNSYYKQPTEQIFMTAQDDDDDDVDVGVAILENQSTSSSTPKTTYNIPELKKEASRLTLRCHKKIGKASTRLSKANEQVEEIRTNPDVTLEELESCPNVKELEDELNDLRTRLNYLNLLEEKLQKLKSGKSVELPNDVLELVLELDVKDEEPKRQVRPPKKKKGPRTEAPRLPYFRYYTENGTEIRVGRRSQDNDELSCNPVHRDGADWWMHASGCPGSHVVIRSHDNNLDKEVMTDAAALAARQSKCNGNVIPVNLTRCRDVKKPPGAKFGLVQLVGKVETVSVNMKVAEKRLERLDKTIKMN